MGRGGDVAVVCYLTRGKFGEDQNDDGFIGAMERPPEQ